MDPTRVSNGTATCGQRRLPVVDVTSFVSLWLLLVFAIPSSLVVGGFGAIGQPGLLFSLIAPAWWCASRFVPSIQSDQEFQPIRLALLLYLAYMVASFGSAGTRSLTRLEIDNSTRELIRLVTLTGLALLVADGMRDLERLRTLLARVALLAGAFAVLGIAQFFAGEFLMPTPRWLSGQPPSIGTRAGLARPQGTARHPIEFAVVVAAMLPLSIHFFLYPRKRNRRVAAAVGVVLLLLAVPVSLSRTGVVSLAAALFVLGLGWSWRRRLNGLLLFLLAIPMISAAAPGVLGVMVGLFTNVDQDFSIQARLSRTSAVMAIVRERPWFGLGFGTWSSDGEFLLDNQIWFSLLETGYVGLTLTILLPILAAGLAISPGNGPATTEETRHLGFAIAGSIAGLSISMITFDAFFYRILTSLLFLLIGAAGALWRFTRIETAPASPGLWRSGRQSPLPADLPTHPNRLPHRSLP